MKKKFEETESNLTNKLNLAAEAKDKRKRSFAEIARVIKPLEEGLDEAPDDLQVKIAHMLVSMTEILEQLNDEGEVN
jgi:hypothetical protein